MLHSITFGNANDWLQLKYHWPLIVLIVLNWLWSKLLGANRPSNCLSLQRLSLCLFSSILFWLHSTCCLIRLVLIHSPSDWLNTGCLKSANMGRPDYMCLCVWLWEIWMCLCETLFVVIVAIMFVYLQVLVFVCMPVKSNSLLALWPGVSQLWDITKYIQVVFRSKKDKKLNK